MTRRAACHECALGKADCFLKGIPTGMFERSQTCRPLGLDVWLYIHHRPPGASGNTGMKAFMG